MSSQPTFPKQYARTVQFSLGVPRAFTAAPDGSRVVFLRSRARDDRTGLLWGLDPGTGRERVLADPTVLLSGGEQLSTAERARRERSREQGAGIVGYATDNAGGVAAFALSSRLFVTELSTATTRELPSATPVVDPRPDPTGRHVAYCADGALRVVSLADDTDRVLAEPDGSAVTWGLAEFIAAEEMGRYRGYWWSPDGTCLLAARVDESVVQTWYLADPAAPTAAPVPLRYPSAGTPNAEVSLHVLPLSGPRVEVRWDRAAFPYLAQVHWSAGGPPLLAVQSRDQRRVRILAIDPQNGETVLLHEQTDPTWVDLVPGTPAWTPGGELVRVGVDEGAYRVFVGDEPVTDPRLQVRAVLDVGAREVLFTAWPDDPTCQHVYAVDYTADPRVTEQLSEGDGLHTAVRSGQTTVLTSSSLRWPGPVTVVRGTNTPDGLTVTSHAETPVLTPNLTMLSAGTRDLRCALLLPTGYRPGDGPLPVLLDPYGGPHAQRVLSAHNAHLVSQWFADQGFAVLVVDGRGTSGRGPAWDRAVAFDFVAVQDQVDALHAVAATHPELDLRRVAIRGWSFGGYLAARAVLDRPDVFHAAVAGAPVTDWRLYTTHYTERYLGDPNTRPEVYDANSLIDTAATLSRPLMLVHGLADDNVISAHTLHMSTALLAAGRPHTVLPLSGTSHMTSHEQVAENLLVLQRDFLRRALGGTD